MNRIKNYGRWKWVLFLIESWIVDKFGFKWIRGKTIWIDSIWKWILKTKRGSGRRGGDRDKDSLRIGGRALVALVMEGEKAESTRKRMGHMLATRADDIKRKVEEEEE